MSSGHACKREHCSHWNSLNKIKVKKEENSADKHNNVVSMFSFYMLLFFQPQLRSRRQKQSPTQILQSSHQATLLPHRPFPQQQDPYQTKATLPHIWTRAKTVLGLPWPNCYTTDTLAHFARLWVWLVILEGLHLCDKSLFIFQFPYVHLLGGLFIWFISVSTSLCSGGVTMWK